MFKIRLYVGQDFVDNFEFESLPRQNDWVWIEGYGYFVVKRICHFIHGKNSLLPHHEYEMTVRNLSEKERTGRV